VRTPRTTLATADEVEEACRKIIRIFPKIVDLYYSGKPSLGALVTFAIQEVYPAGPVRTHSREFFNVMTRLLDVEDPRGKDHHH